MSHLQKASLACLLLTACGGGKDATAPDVLHVANVSFTEHASCGSASCSGTLRFQLLTQSSTGRAGKVTITGSTGWETRKTVTTQTDGWGSDSWGFDPYYRPLTLTVCPEGVTDNTRCGTAASSY